MSTEQHEGDPSTKKVESSELLPAQRLSLTTEEAPWLGHFDGLH